MQTEIYWTDRSEQHIARHGVTPGEVEQVVFTRPRWLASGREGTTLCLGVTDAGRHLLVVLVASTAAQACWYCVTARDMTGSERRLFLKRTS
ncbi:hypothetical protein ABTX81_12925 [Kitasatospora sp. NPDC097605]|uniref:hypothetical protein n=1 Tax=Kitasatospora sp. NPDC097605 TaxID=3157226 RepID=UPI00331B95D5